MTEPGRYSTSLGARVQHRSCRWRSLPSMFWLMNPTIPVLAVSLPELLVFVKGVECVPGMLEINGEGHNF